MQNPAPGRVRRRRPALLAASVLYFGALSAVVLTPAPVDRGTAGALLRQLLEHLHNTGIPAWVDYSLVETAANVLLFVPLGLLVGTWLGSRWTWLAAVAGCCLSMAVETSQALLLPGRVPTLQDVLANTLGAALGTVAVYVWRAARPGTAARA